MQLFRKVGILGGSFDPVHNGHLSIARDCIYQAGLDMVYFMPNIRNPLKGEPTVASPQNRYRMLELALQNEPKMDVLDYEITQKHPVYTIQTAKKLKKNWPKVRFFWIIGSDALQTLPYWKEIEQIGSYIEFLLVTRPSYAYKLPNIENLSIKAVNNELVCMSASEIRNAFKREQPLEGVLPEAVYTYILVNKLYT